MPCFLLSSRAFRHHCLFCPFTSLSRLRFSHPYSSFIKNYVGLLGMPHFIWLGWAHGPFEALPFLLSICSCRIGLLGLLLYSFLLRPFQGLFLFLEEGHPTVADSSTLPISCDQSMCPCPYSLCAFSLFWPLLGPCLFTL